ncbi:MAG: methyl-accepting chemotaxis protein [Clostridiales bacterium]|nr:methyl-accepting chemotaxis protein [Clostridiales bacterium]
MNTGNNASGRSSRGLTIRGKLVMAFGLSLVIVLAMGIYALLAFKNINDNSKSITNDMIPRINGVNSLKTAVSEFRILEYGHVTENKKYVKKQDEDLMQTKKAEIEEAIAQNEQHASGDSEKKLIADVKAKWEAYFAFHNDIIEMSNAFQNVKVNALISGDSAAAYSELSTSIAGLVDQNVASAQTVGQMTEKVFGQSQYVLVFTLVIALVFCLLAAILIIQAVTKPIGQLNRKLRELAEKGGDLTHSIDIKSRDEIGELAYSVNQFISNIRTIMVEVNKNSDIVSESALTVSKHLDELNDHVENTSATVEQMSAGMEETSATAEEVSATSADIETSIEAMAGKAAEGARAASEISRRAVELKQGAVASKEAALKIYEETRTGLEEALARSKAVEQIDVLSNTILSITSQTNLLALNAAIEAARAGEAGKGFAVVSEEIRKLAENSKQTVIRIQEVSKEVTAAVDSLKNSSVQIMNFMDSNVINDYGQMISIGEQYNGDAIFVDKLVTDFSATSKELTTSVEGIIRAIGEVAKTVGEGALGTQSIAEKTMNIVEKVAEVQRQMENTTESAHALKETVSKFKV